MCDFHHYTRTKCSQYLIQANNLCVICFKECGLNTAPQGMLLCRVLERYFGVNFLVPELSVELPRNGTFIPMPKCSNIHFLLCDDCSVLAITISQLLQQLEVVQMRLHAYGQTICDIMTSAEKVKSRVATFKRRLPLVHKKSEGLTRTIVQNIRREIIKKCKRKATDNRDPLSLLSTMQVVIKKEIVEDDKYPVNFPTMNDSKQSSGLPEPGNESHLALLGCTLSFWIVILLSLLEVDLPVKPESVVRIENTSIGLAKDPTDISVPYLGSNPHNMPLFDANMNLKRRKSSNSESNTTKKLAIDFPKPLEFVHVKTDSISDGESSHEAFQKDVIRKKFQDAFFKSSDEIRKRQSPIKVEMSPRPEVKRKSVRQMKVEISPSLKRKRGRPRKFWNYTKEQLQLSSVITAEDASYAVNESQVPKATGTGTKVVEVNRESEVKLPFPTAQIKLDFPSFDENNRKVESDDGEDLTDHLGQQEAMEPISLLPACAVEFVETLSDNGSSSTPIQSLVPINNQSNIFASSYKCHVCQLQFSVRGQIEKHRVVAHNFTNYVECPLCFQMFPSYFHLELHRKDVPKCDLVEQIKQAEMYDIARPFFPFEPLIRGRNFCPIEGCYEVFEDVNNLIFHMRVHGRFQCWFGCPQTFEKGYQVALHELRFHQNSPFLPNIFNCPRCSFKTDERDAYIIHFIIEHLNITPPP